MFNNNNTFSQIIMQFIKIKITNQNPLLFYIKINNKVADKIFFLKFRTKTLCQWAHVLLSVHVQYNRLSISFSTKYVRTAEISLMVYLTCSCELHIYIGTHTFILYNYICIKIFYRFYTELRHNNKLC